jgi:hypothetical protein
MKLPVAFLNPQLSYARHNLNKLSCGPSPIYDFPSSFQSSSDEKEWVGSDAEKAEPTASVGKAGKLPAKAVAAWPGRRDDSR